MQGIDLRAAVGVRMTVGVVAGGGVGLPVAVRPRISLALGYSDGGVNRVVDGQMQGIDLRAAVGVRMTVFVVA